MSKRSQDLLVVDPSLSYLAFADRITPARFAQVKADLGEFADQIVFAPYSQKLHRQLKAHKSTYYAAAIAFRKTQEYKKWNI